MQRDFQFLAVMHFHQHRHAHLVRQGLKRFHLIKGQRCRDQQDGVRPHRPRLVDLVLMHHEILAQHRQTARRARLLQIGCTALEKLLVGQHRQARGAVPRITARNLRRMKILTDYPFARAGFFYFGNHCRMAYSNFASDRPDEIAHRCRLFRFGTDDRQWLGRQCGRDFLVLYRKDFVEDVGHIRVIPAQAGIQ